MPNTRTARPTKLDKVHRFSSDLDRCCCGAEWVYFEPLFDTDGGDDSGWGYGCDKVGRPARPEVDARGRSVDR